MKKPMSNITKIILTILATIVVLAIIILIIHITRNAIILNRLSNLLNSNISANNYHYEENIKHKDIDLIKELYKKNDTYVEYTYAYDKENVNSFIVYSNGKEVIMIENNKLKTDNENANSEKYEERTIKDVITLNSVFLEDLSIDKLVNTKIYFDKNYNTYMLSYGNGRINFWLNASTGLPIKSVFEEEIRTYTFEFNNVTEENVAKPNISQTEAQ